MIRTPVRPIAVSLRFLGLFALVASGVVFADTADPDFSDGRIVAGFDFECTSPEVFRSAGLAPVVADVVERDREDVPSFWGERAFRIDLDVDGHPEFFVPLLCGGTCGCHWALVGGAPRKVIGELDACAIFVHESKSAGAWSVLTTMGRAGATQGYVLQYTWNRAGNAYKESYSSEVTGIVYEAFLEGIGNPDCRIRTNLPAPGKATP